MTRENESKGTGFEAFMHSYFDLCEDHKIFGPALGFGFLLFAFLFLISLSAPSGEETRLKIQIEQMKQDAKDQEWLRNCETEYKPWKCEMLLKNPGSPWQWLDQPQHDKR